MVTHIQHYAKKLYGDGLSKTSKGYTITANYLRDYLKKKNDVLLFSDVTPSLLNFDGSLARQLKDVESGGLRFLPVN